MNYSGNSGRKELFMGRHLNGRMRRYMEFMEIGVKHVILFWIFFIRHYDIKHMF